MGSRHPARSTTRPLRRADCERSRACSDGRIGQPSFALAPDGIDARAHVSAPTALRRARLPWTSRLGGVFLRLGCCPPPRRGFSSWPAETSESLSPSRARSANAVTTRRARANATTQIVYPCASTAAGVASTPATGRPASAGALSWLADQNVQNSGADGGGPPQGGASSV